MAFGDVVNSWIPNDGAQVDSASVTLFNSGVKETTAGNLIVAIIGVTSGGDSFTIPTGYLEYNTQSDNDEGIEVVYRIATGDSDDDIDFSWVDTGRWAVCVYEIEGPFDESSLLDGAGSSTDNISSTVASSSPGSASPSSTDGVAVTCLFIRNTSDAATDTNGGGVSLNAGYDTPTYSCNYYAAHPTVAIATQVYASTAAIDPTWTFSGSSQSASVQMFFKEDTGGGSGAITKRVNGTGADSGYISLAAAIASMSDGNDYVVDCDAILDTTAVAMPEGWTDFSCIIRATPGTEHKGVIGAGYVLETAAAASLLLSNCDNVTVQDIEISNNSPDAVTYALRNSGTSSPNNRFRRLILRHPNATHITQKCAHITTKVAQIDNILCYEGEQGIFVRDGNVIRSSTAIGQIRCFNTDYSDCVAINCVAFPLPNASYDGPLTVEGFGADGGGTWLTASCSYNASNDTSSPGANAADNITTSDFADYAAGDYSPAFSGALHNTGADLSAYFDDDITGEVRTTLDRGAFAYVGGSGSLEASVSFGAEAGSTYGGQAVAEGAALFGVGAYSASSAQATAAAAVSGGVSVGCTTTCILAVEASISPALTAGMEHSAQVQADAAISHGVNAGIVASGQAEALGAISGAADAGYAVTGSITAGGDIEESLTFGVDLTGTKTAEATAYASVLTASGLTVSVDATAQIDAALAAGVTASTTITSDVSIEGVISVDAQTAAQMSAEAQASAAALMTQELATQIIAEAATEAGIAVAQVMGVTFTGSSISGDLVTPDRRTFTVTAEVRAFTVAAESRTFTVH